VTGLAAAVHDAEAIAAPGTDPELVASLVAAIVDRDPLRPSRTAARLAREGVDGDEVLARLRRPVSHAAADALAMWRTLGVRAAAVGDQVYPAALAEDWPARGQPPLIAWRGPDSGPGDAVAAAIVGARRATSYGVGIASWLADAAARAGVVIVSGGAVGVDAAAHAGALGCAGATVAVLGCGHGVGYPAVHASDGGLFDRILAAGGCLVSELPPTARPEPQNVLARNRIVAGLARAVVVVEGRVGSGSLVTGGIALEYGRDVLAVPGDVRAPGSAAPHALIRDGAQLCRDPSDLLAVLGAAAADAVRSGDEPTSMLPDSVRAILAAAWPRALGFDELAITAGVPTGRLLAVLTAARVAGEVAEGLDGIRLARAPRPTPTPGRAMPRSGR